MEDEFFDLNIFQGLGPMGESFMLTPSHSGLTREMLFLLRDNINMIIAIDESTNDRLHKISFYMKQPNNNRGFNDDNNSDGDDDGGNWPPRPRKPLPVRPIETEWEA